MSISLNVFCLKLKELFTRIIMSEIIPKKKRGRKPKNFSIIQSKTENPVSEESVNSEEEKVIFHLPITIDEINTNDNNDMGIFIKSEKDLKESKLNLHKLKSSEDSDSTETLKTSVNNTITNTLGNKLNLNSSVNKIITTNLSFTQKTKCWWCRNCFNTPALQLPEDYYNETFYCVGNFCSWNCKKAFNLDLNDTLTWKRDSLINLLYNKTYGQYIEITPSPHWMCLEEYGGNMSIDDFRKCAILNTKEYLVLHPPLISRQMQIEESYKTNKLKEVPIDKVNKIYSEIDSEYTIKRNKPIQSNQLNLETTMGLIKKKKSKSKGF